MNSNNNILVKLNNAGFRQKEKWLVEGVSLEVENGKCLALLGPSGCGKSSTLRVIAGLDAADEGSIQIKGKDVTNISPVERNVAMVFQSYALFPHLSVASNLSLASITTVDCINL